MVRKLIANFAVAFSYSLNCPDRSAVANIGKKPPERPHYGKLVQIGGNGAVTANRRLIAQTFSYRFRLTQLADEARIIAIN